MRGHRRNRSHSHRRRRLLLLLLLLWQIQFGHFRRWFECLSLHLSLILVDPPLLVGVPDNLQRGKFDYNSIFPLEQIHSPKDSCRRAESSDSSASATTCRKYRRTIRSTVRCPCRRLSPSCCPCPLPSLRPPCYPLPVAVAACLLRPPRRIPADSTSSWASKSAAVEHRNHSVLGHATTQRER